MLLKNTIVSSKVILRDIEYSDCNNAYLSWLQNENVNRYLETRWEEQTIDKIVGFVNYIRNSNHSILMAIIDNDEDYGLHVGNIKLGPINYHNKCADVSYFIGNVDYWNKGYATEAVRLIIKYGFYELGLHRIAAGVIEGNSASEKLLHNVGMSKEGVYIDASCVSPGRYKDIIKYAIINPND